MSAPEQQTKPMTCRELIALLSEHDPELLVYVNGFEAGLADIVRVERVAVRRDWSWAIGPHKIPEETDPAAWHDAAQPGLYLVSECDV